MIPTAGGGLSLLFTAIDSIRRTQGEGLGLLGFGPVEHSHRIVASGSLWRLRHYAGPDVGPTLLIVAAPIKRPYIWDLAPSVSAVRYCLRHGLRIYLLEWRPPHGRSAVCGLAEYADDAISEALAALMREVGPVRPFLMGALARRHLGGDLRGPSPGTPLRTSASWRATLHASGGQPLSGCPRCHTAIAAVGNGNCSGILVDAIERDGIARNFCLVEAVGRRDQCHGSTRIRHPSAGGALVS